MPVGGITEPGVYNLTAQEYHADPVANGSLSSTEARLLMPPSCPAKFRYTVEHGRPPKREFDLGHAAHAEILGAGAELVVVDADSWRTNAAKQKQADAYAAGKTPIRADDYVMVQEMAAAVRAHPYASVLLSPEYMVPEQTLVWRDEETGIWCRAMLDGLPRPAPQRMIVPDYKTAKAANRAALSKALYEYGYNCQADWYLAGVRALGLDPDPAFVFVVQEKTPPYLINVFQPDALSLEIAARRNRKARHLFAECMATDTWPGYEDEVFSVGLPGWAVAEHSAADERGDFDLEENQE